MGIDSDWMLFDSGYSVNVAPYGDEFAFRVHVNQLKQLGGDIKSAKFRLFVSERLKMHDVCPGGWEEQLCPDEASCVQRTAHSVTVFGRCIPRYWHQPAA
jgi:hypothetical protein